MAPPHAIYCTHYSSDIYLIYLKLPKELLNYLEN